MDSIWAPEALSMLKMKSIASLMRHARRRATRTLRDSPQNSKPANVARATGPKSSCTTSPAWFSAVHMRVLAKAQTAGSWERHR